MGKRVTHESFVEEVQILTSGEYTVLRVYKKAKEKIEIRHNKCGNEYLVTPDNFKSGRRCPSCANDIRRKSQSSSIEELRESVYELVGDEYTLLDGEYINARTSIKMKHNKCGHEWGVTPNHFVKNETRCPKCADRRLGESKRKSQGDFRKEVLKITDDEYEVVGEYINAITKIDILHKSCNSIYNVEPNSFLGGNRCNKCKSSTSKGEKYIMNYLELNNIEFRYQYTFDDCRNKNPLPFDFAIVNNIGKVTTLIEFDGRHHFELIEFWGGEKEFERIKMCDIIKNKYCKDNGIEIIRIPHWEYENIENILDNTLKKGVK